MGLFSGKHNVYVVFSFRGLYAGKGSGLRAQESCQERHGLFVVIVSRYYFAKNAFRAEARLIRALRWLKIPLQNGKAPRTSLWRRLFGIKRRKRRRSFW
jgi:hypothetical protein